jgi:hypothetical protein
MSIFQSIANAIFGHHAAPAQAPAAQPPLTGAHASGQVSAMPQVGQPQAAPAPSQAAPAAPIDVEAFLAEKQRAKGGADLNWRSSIVDLMKLLDLDSSLANRSELATELGYTGAKDGSAEMNTWLHREVMRKLAASGGTVPAELQH